jgi:hypothetical protein
MSLKTELDAFRADFMAKASAEVREAMAAPMRSWLLLV